MTEADAHVWDCIKRAYCCHCDLCRGHFGTTHMVSCIERKALDAVTINEHVLAAFREITGWSDAEVLHYLACDECVPICGHEEYDCPASPRSVTTIRDMA